MMPHTSSTSSSSVRFLAASMVFLLGLGVLLAAVQFVMFPRHDRDKLWSDYLELPAGSVDVLLLGTSLIHANVNPAVMWHETGVRAYALSGSEQSLLTTGPYLDEALRAQQPSVVVIDLHMISSDNRELSENQKRSNLTMMPLGMPKVRAIVSSLPGSEWTRFILPLEQFHSRWSELQRKDFSLRKWRSDAEDFFLGYRRVDRVDPQRPSDERRAFDPERYQRNYALLSDAITIAESSDARVLLLVGPSSRPAIHDEWIEVLRRDLRRDHPNAEILDTARKVTEMGVDPQTDYYDQWHLNSRGAEKYSRWLAVRLLESYGSLGRREDPAAAAWQAAYERYGSD